MNQTERGQAHLKRTLQRLADIEASTQAPPSIERAVLARWDVAHSPRGRARARVKHTVRVAAATAAAGLTIFAVLATQRGTCAPGTTAAPPNDRRGYTTVAVVGGPLLADEPIRVVRMRVARSVLGELGIPSTAAHGAAQAGTVDIDVLVGEDGVARGVRVPINEL